MSAVVERFIVCDYSRTPECAGNFGVDHRSRSIAKHRRDARQMGWFYRNGKDYCPSCAKELKMKRR